MGTAMTYRIITASRIVRSDTVVVANGVLTYIDSSGSVKQLVRDEVLAVFKSTESNVTDELFGPTR